MAAWLGFLSGAVWFFGTLFIDGVEMLGGKRR
jgi:hypothetical protein